MKRQTNDLLTHTELDLTDPEYFEFETHIMFDDSMSWNERGERSVNNFVSDFVEVVQESAVQLHGFNCKILLSRFLFSIGRLRKNAEPSRL